MKHLLLLLCIFPFLLCAQAKDSLYIEAFYPETHKGLAFSVEQAIVPTILIGLGVYSSKDKTWNEEIQKRAQKWNGDTSVEDVLMFLPGASIYTLDWGGVKSKHNFMDKTVIATTTAALTIGSIYLLKKVSTVERPDGSSPYSFPSGHTAVAFAGAELLWQEYRHHSVWYGIAGYGIATGTGFLRIYNNTHWFSDVLAGAGIGILSAKAAYWLYPSIRKLYNKKEAGHISIVPYGNSSSFGLSLVARF